jgi:hypothetical protein
MLRDQLRAARKILKASWAPGSPRRIVGTILLNRMGELQRLSLALTVPDIQQRARQDLTERQIETALKTPAGTPGWPFTAQGYRPVSVGFYDGKLSHVRVPRIVLASAVQPRTCPVCGTPVQGWRTSKVYCSAHKPSAVTTVAGQGNTNSH